MTGFKEQFQLDAAACDAVLKQLIAASTGPASQLRDAMEYGLLNGGKRVRASLVLAAARMVSGDMMDTVGALRTAAAIECLHAYSLIHDDLPAMDDADTRRGKPSCHRLFDEATAILAGDALQSMAFDILAADSTHSDATVRVRLIAQLAQSSGLAGMAGGQMLDLQAEERPFDIAETKQMQMMKTGALISCAVLSGGIVAGADHKLLSAQAAYARHLGLAFQIADDILDVEGTVDVVGKATGKDSASGKATYVSLLGLEGAKRRAQALVDEACMALDDFGDRGDILKAAARFVVSRDL